MWKNDSNPIDKLNKVTFIPVLYQVTNIYKNKDFDIGFWTSKALCKYPYFLVNAYHHKKRFSSTIKSLLG